MSTVVLARKYRPKSFAQMVGQEHVVRALTNALQQQRLHHAYLFTGTRGIGKTTVSRILAKSLNCTGADGQGGITAQPCGVCQACTEIDADRYLDYIEMDAASNGGKDEIRDLIERAAYKPGLGRFKVFMIDEAHQLSKDAFNALLKTLEEPPDYLKFVLATTDPDKVLPTVLSRCLQFNLRPMAPETVRAHLQQVLDAESVGHDDGALRLLATAARGSMRDALSLTDQAIAYGAGRLDADVVRAMLGSVDRGHATAIVEALAGRDGPAVLAAVDGLRGLGLSATGLLDEMAALLQQMAVQQAVPGALDADDPDAAAAVRLAALLPPDETQLLYSIVLQGRGELALMSDEYGALTMVLLRLLAFPPAAPAGGAAPRPAPARAVPLRVATKAVIAVPAPVPGGARLAAAATQASPQAPASAPSLASAPSPVAAAASGASAPKPAPVFMATPTATPTAAPAQTSLRTSVPVSIPVAMSMPTQASTDPLAAAAASAPASTAAPAPASTAAPAPASTAAPSSPLALRQSTVPPPSPLADRWDALARRLAQQGALAALVRELAWQASLTDADDVSDPPRWRLEVERETLRAPALATKLAAAVTAVLGHPVLLDLVAGTPADTPARRDAVERDRLQALAEQTIRDDPLVVSLLAQFKTARIVPGSIKPV